MSRICALKATALFRKIKKIRRRRKLVVNQRVTQLISGRLTMIILPILGCKPNAQNEFLRI